MATTVVEEVPDLLFKAVTAETDAPGTVDVQPDEGIVTALVSITGIEDSVQDIIEPGAYAETLKTRRPKVVWHHSWEKPIGRVLHIEELLPGDSRLPKQTKDGKAWPVKAGGLLATMQMNLKSERGREAFEAIRFYSESGECEYSIGYQVPAGKSTRTKAGVRHISQLDLWELSVVLFGAASETGTLSLKAAYEAAMKGKDQDPSAKAADTVATETPGEPAPEPFEPAVNPTPDEVIPEGTEPVADQPVDDPDPVETPDPVHVPDDDDVAVLIAGFTDADVAALEADITELTEADFELVESYVAQVKAVTPGGRVGDDTPVGTPGGTPNWVDKVGGLPKYIRMVAHALIRRGFTESRAIATAVATMKRWAAGAGKVSAKVQAAAAKALAEWEAKKGAAHAKSLWDQAKEDARLHPAEAKAVEWSPLLERGQYAGSKQVTPSSYRDYPKIEGTFEERIDAVRGAVCDALIEPAADGEDTKRHVSIAGTWPDRVVATIIDWSTDSDDNKESFEMNYSMGDDGEVTLSEPQPVQLTVYIEPAADDPNGDDTDPDNPMGDMLGLPDMVQAALNTAMGLASFEAKAGRVLSGVNEARLKGALESLIAVLGQAGIKIDLGDAPKVTPPRVDMESTAPSAAVKAVQLDAAAVKAQLAALGLT